MSFINRKKTKVIIKFDIIRLIFNSLGVVLK